MAETQAVLSTLKQCLRSKNLTYAAVARGLGMSEANVKRLFASKRITLDRVEAICGLLDMRLGDLFDLYELSRQRISQLTATQEQELVKDTQLLFVAVCVRNHVNFADILQHYRIEKPSLIRRLAQLDRLKIIDLLPNNRIKLRIAENFSWIPNGPIERYFDQAVKDEFLQKGFDAMENPQLFLWGLLGESSRAVVRNRLTALSNEFAELHRQDRKLPLDDRQNIGILIAMRQWEFSRLIAYAKK